MKYRLPLYPYRLWMFLSFFMWSLSVYGNHPRLMQLEMAINRQMPLESLLFETGDSAILSQNQLYHSALSNADTLKAIEELNKLSSMYCNRVEYGKSYDGYWQALLWADHIGAEEMKAVSYNGLAILFSLYERREEALDYYEKSLNLKRSLVEKGEVEKEALRMNYFPLAVHYRYEGEIDKANTYLDSCVLLNQSAEASLLFIKAERGYLLTAAGKFLEAEKLLLRLLPQLKERDHSYLAVINSGLGDLYQALGKYEQAEQYFKDAIESALKNKSHLNFVPDIYEKLAAIATLFDRPLKANEYLVIAHSINKTLYSSRSPKNRYLLAIKDEFRLEKERLQQIAREQKLAQLEQEEDIWYLKTVILVISIIFILITAGGIFILLLTKHKNEKTNLQQQRLLEEQKSKEIISVKNKELTGSTLQLIAKDELLSDLKEGLKNLPEKGREVNKLIKQINLNKDQSWLSFEHRFNAVNESFYENLKQEYPDLKPYDLKICSLIKLDFSGKEMARLLGISPESANTARYRLRKKLGLKREDNLVEFMGRF